MGAVKLVIMKSTKHILISALLLLLAVCLQGCGGHGKESELVFKDVRQCRLETCSEPFFCDTYKDLWVLDDCFVVVGYSRASEKYIHVFDKQTGAYKSSFVARGRSGDEVLSVTDTYLAGDELYIWDAMQKALISCDLGDAMNAVALPLTRYDGLAGPAYTHILSNGRRAVMVANASFIENAPINDKPRLLSVDLLSGDEASYDGYPINDRFKTWWMYMQPVISTNRSMQKIALLSNCYYGCVMELFEASADTIRCTHTQTLSPPDFEGKANGATPGDALCYGAIDAVCTDDYVIVAFDGETRVTDKDAASSFNKVLWFDWSGKPVRKLVIDRSVTCLCMDKQDLYALVRTEDGDAVIVRIYF